MTEATQKKYDEITPEEWAKYVWYPIDSFSDVYVRSYEKTTPPDDEYEYVDVTAMGDSKQQWVRGMLKEDE